MMCHRIGFPPISTIGLGRTSVSSARRVPSPPARIPTFICPPRSDLSIDRPRSLRLRVDAVELGENAVLRYERGRLETRVDAQLGQHVLDVRASGLRADDELFGDRLAACPLGKQGKNLLLSPRQLIQLPASLVLEDAMVDQPSQQPPQQAGGGDPLTPPHR